jgi:hypothetical protein
MYWLKAMFSLKISDKILMKISNPLDSLPNTRSQSIRKEYLYVAHYMRMTLSLHSFLKVLHNSHIKNFILIN